MIRKLLLSRVAFLVLVWMPRFAEKTVAESRILFYRAAGAYLSVAAK